MADQKLRELERRWQATGSVEDEAAWLVGRLRVGDLDEERLQLAAYLGHEPARLAAPQALKVFAKRLDRAGGPIEATTMCYDHPPTGVLAGWSAVLPEVSKDVCVRASIAACNAALLASSNDRATRTWANQVIDAVETWLLSPRTPASLRTLANYWWSHTRNPPFDDPFSIPAVGWAFMNAQVLASYDPEGAGDAPDDEEEFRQFCEQWADNRAVLGDVLAGAQHALGVEQTSTIEEAVREELVPWLLGRGDPVADRVRARASARSTRKQQPLPAGSRAGRRSSKKAPVKSKKKAPARSKKTPARSKKTRRT